MDKRQVIDMTIIFVCLAALGITVIYPEQIRMSKIILYIFGTILFLFFIVILMDYHLKQKISQKTKETLTRKREIRELVLLSEEDTELHIWDIYGKIAVVIGRDEKENQVDIDLKTGPYASMVEVEHAVMNFSSGDWYVEDIGSRNGIQIKKEGDKKIYQLSANMPCKLDCGDILYIGFNRLLLRD